MLMSPFMNIIFLEFLLVLLCCLGDYHLQHPVAKQHAVVAIGDSLTHGIIAGISWAIICDFKCKRLEIQQCIICVVLAILAMLVDIDHFVAAGSFNLKAALSLPARPPFHASSMIIAVDMVMLILAAIFRSQNLVLSALIFTTAWSLHHVRDGYRRGLWFYPFGETLPLPRIVYLGIIITFPSFMKVVYKCLYEYRLKDNLLILEEEQVV